MSEWNYIAIVNFLAILLGPIVAVFASRYIDYLRSNKRKKLDLFKTLFTRRKSIYSKDFVDALHYIPIEFIKHKDVTNSCDKVVKAHNDYNNLFAVNSDPSGLEINKGMNEVNDQINLLILEIGKLLGYNLNTDQILQFDKKFIQELQEEKHYYNEGSKFFKRGVEHYKEIEKHLIKQ
jgi:hypothetical protein